MHEIRERTVVKTAEGEKVLLPGRITNAEAAEYGLLTTVAAPVEPEPEAKDDAPAKAKATKKAAG